MPRRSATPGRLFSTSASAFTARRRTRSRPCSFLMSMTMLRLLRLKLRKAAVRPPRCGPTLRRIESPSGGSILMTSAPRSPSSCVQNGPEMTAVRSRMRKPISGPSAMTKILQALTTDARASANTSRDEAECHGSRSQNAVSLGSVAGRLWHAHAESDPQVVAVERIDVDHPAERLFQQMTARGFALRRVGDFAGESEASVGEEAEALVDCGCKRT